MRPIDADALVQMYEELKDRYKDGICCEVLDSIINDINNAPTIEPNKISVNVEYDVEYRPDKDGVHLAKATIDKSTDQNVKNVPSGYMCFSCKYGSRIGMPCKECKHDYEDKYTPINKYGTIPSWNADLISRESAICAIENTDCELTAGDWDELTDAINELPSADVVSREEYNKLLANSIWESEHIGKMFEYIDDCVTEMCGRPKVNSDSAEEQIAELEQKSNRPKGDLEPAPVVAYICDRRRCAICRGEDGGCDHTTDIKHAAHFKNVAGQYFERPYMEEEKDDE